MTPILRHHGLTGSSEASGDDSSGVPANTFLDSWNPALPAGVDPNAPVNAFTTGYVATAHALTASNAAQSAATTLSTDNTGTIYTTSQSGSGGLMINVTYDESVANLNTPGNAAYNPALYNEYVGAVQAAVQFYENTFTNAITVSINFGWGEVGGSPTTPGAAIDPGASGESNTYQYVTTYSALYAAVAATDTTSAVQLAAVASLPATDPTNGTLFDIATAEAAALGFNLQSAPVGGFVGLDSTQAWAWSQNNVTGLNEDAVGTLEHEISEVLGRFATGGTSGNYSLLDMFRYTAADGGATDAPGTAVGARDEPFDAGYSTTAPASASPSLNSYSYFSYNGTTVTLPYETPADVAQGADVGDWAPSVAGDSYADGPVGQPAPVSATDLEEMNVLGYDLACYLPGTLIATPRGEVLVQDLAIGDMVLTHRGEARPIVWIGQGKALATRGRRNAATPVIVRKGALAHNVPNRDLRITKGHALYLDGVLIPVEFLVNHRSILWDDRAQEVQVYHIELAVHDVLLANNAPAESYRDDGNRWLFRNSNDGWQQAAKPACAPVLTGGPVVDAVWRRLLARSGKRPGLPLTDEPDLHLLVNGRRMNGTPGRNGVHVFRLPASPDTVRVVSRAGAQDELGLARDPRVLGVALQRIILWRGRHPIIVEADNPTLCHGFHAFEPDNGFRWTDGNAVLPASLFAGAGKNCELELHVASTTHYPMLREAAGMAA